MSADTVMEILERAAKDAVAAGCDEAELSYVGRTLGTSRFANSYLTQTCVIVERQVRVRVNRGGRVGAATTSALDHASLQGTARRAIEVARHQPKTDFPGFARDDKSVAEGRSVHDPATAAYGPGDRADALARVFARAEEERLVCAGSFHTGERELVVVTSPGVRRRWTGTEASLAVIALDLAADVSSYAAFHAPSVAGFDPQALAEDAVTRAARARDPIDLAPGAYDVVLSPHAVAEMLEWMALASFTARTVMDGTSLLAGNQGATLCDGRITIVDDVAFDHPLSSAPGFDAEGTATQRVALIDGGKGGVPLTDLSTASKLGTASTGHAPPFGALLADGPTVANMILLPGDKSHDELVASVERGLLITRFHYVNGLLDTRRAVMTGMTRDGAFLIENGRPGRAVKNLRFTDSILDALSPARLGGVGRDLHAVPNTWTGTGATLCPALLLRDFHFTGRSR